MPSNTPKYDDVPGGGGAPPWMEIWDGPGGQGGGGFSPSSVPSFSFGALGGSAQPFGGFGQQSQYAQPFRRLMGNRGMGQGAFSGNAGSMGGRMAGPMGNLPIGPGRYGVPSATPQGGGGPFEQGALGPIGALIQNAFLGGNGSYGGLFGQNPSALLAGVRARGVEDAAARERAARLGLQGRSDIDPSTFGFQSLMSQLGGQHDTAQAMNQADLAVRQQQAEHYWNLLSQLLSGQYAQNQTETAGRWAHANQPGGLGGALQGLGGLAGGLFGGGGGRTGGGAQAPRMGEGGYRYPLYGGG